MHDPLHMLLSNGCMNFELFELFNSIGFSTAYRDLNTIAAKPWCRPYIRKGNSYKAPLGDSHLEATRKSDAGVFRGMASELLSILPLVRLYVDGSQSIQAKQRDSFRACHDLVCLYLRSKSTGDVLPSTLDRKASLHMQAFIDAYGKDRLKPKHHQVCFHLGDNVRKNGGRAVDCFCQERKGGLMKQSVENIDDTSRYERTALHRLLNYELHRLAMENLWQDQLQGRLHPWPEIAEAYGYNKCMAALRATVNHITYRSGDLLVVDDALHCILECVMLFDDVAYAMVVQPLADRMLVTSTASTWHVCDDELEVLWLEGRRLGFAEFWLKQSDGRLLVLHR